MSELERVADAIRTCWTKQVSGGLPAVTWAQLARAEQDRWVECAAAAIAELSPRED